MGQPDFKRMGTRGKGTLAQVEIRSWKKFGLPGLRFNQVVPQAGSRGRKKLRDDLDMNRTTALIGFDQASFDCASNAGIVGERVAPGEDDKRTGEESGPEAD